VATGQETVSGAAEGRAELSIEHKAIERALDQQKRVDILMLFMKQFSCQ
jgi:hypothetical protein